MIGQPDAAELGAADADQECGRAMTLQLAGRLAVAEQLYRSILRAQPTHAIANHCLGMLQVQLQRPASGLPFLLAALNAQPEVADYWLGYVEALLQAGELEHARSTLTLARQHGLSGKAVEDLATRLTGPSHRADADLLSLVAQHRFDDACRCARRMTERFPEHGLGWKILGALLWAERRADEGLAALRTAARLLPRDAETHSNLGIALAALKRFDEAESCLCEALTVDPGFAPAHYRLGMYYELQARYDEAEASLRKAISLRAGGLTTDDEQGYSNLMFVLSHNANIGAAALFQEHLRTGACFEADVRESWPQHANSPDPDRRLRIGFVSADFREHSVATFMLPVLERLSRRPGLALHAYSTHGVEDRVTARLRRYVHHWQPAAALTDVELAERIRADGIDILFDLSGHTAANRLRTFARKPAPLQVSWLGYPGTTGLSAMDYYLADAHWLPPGRYDELFTEKLVYLPERWAFERHPDAPRVNPLPALTGGRLTFCSFHRLGKINEATVAMWAKLLLAVPESCLLLAGVSLDAEQATLQQRFSAHGIASGRLRFKRRSSMRVYLGVHDEVDIALDTYPYAGATTSVHSLSMGVPTLTVAGSTAAARAGAGILAQAGVHGFTATDPADFVRKGLEWSRRLPELAELRATLRARLEQSPAGRPDLIAAHLEGALRHMWRRWCAGLPPESFHSAAPE